MPRPSNGYYKKDGSRVFSVTEVLSKFKDPSGLLGWAFANGVKSGEAASKGLPAPRSYKQDQEQAAEAGSICHDLFECYILGRQYEFYGKKPAAHVVTQAHNAFENAKHWLSGSTIKIVGTEESLVSEEHGFGGTYDALGVDCAEHYRLLDWKSSKKLYADYLIQLAAYGILVKECKGIDVFGYDILRFDKTNADFEHRFFMDLEDGKHAFLAMLQALPYVNKLEARV